MDSQDFKIKVNGTTEHQVSIANDNSITINEDAAALDVQKVKPGVYHVIRDNKSYVVEEVKSEEDGKLLTLKINGNKYQVALKDKYDELLHRLGMDNISAGKINEIKAPMPGLVLNIIADEGSTVKKGDPLIVLEAMKMENILKSPTDGTVKKIAVKKGTAVEKNQVLISFS